MYQVLKQTGAYHYNIVCAVGLVSNSNDTMIWMIIRLMTNMLDWILDVFFTGFVRAIFQLWSDVSAHIKSCRCSVFVKNMFVWWSYSYSLLVYHHKKVFAENSRDSLCCNAFNSLSNRLMSCHSSVTVPMEIFQCFCFELWFIFNNIRLVKQYTVLRSHVAYIMNILMVKGCFRWDFTTASSVLLPTWLHTTYNIIRTEIVGQSASLTWTIYFIILPKLWKLLSLKLS